MLPRLPSSHNQSDFSNTVIFVTYSFLSSAYGPSRVSIEQCEHRAELEMEAELWSITEGASTLHIRKAAESRVHHPTGLLLSLGMKCFKFFQE